MLASLVKVAEEVEEEEGAVRWGEVVEGVLVWAEVAAGVLVVVVVEGGSRLFTFHMILNNEKVGYGALEAAHD